MRDALLTIVAAVLIPLVGSRSPAQTTQGLIEGHVTDLRTGEPVANCKVGATLRADGANEERFTGADGSYILAPLSPGAYDLRIDCGLYQRQESHNVQLEVAASLLINVRVRALNEVWEDNYRRLMVLPDSSLLTLYGPDVDISHTSVVQPLRGSPAALETTVSQTIDSRALSELPLSGRDAYTLIVLQPGVTADTGTSRSLALSVNGQRASASKFLLDGIENDNPLVTGPLSPIAPEALAEYRVSSNSFSAEYGRVSGYVANAITRSGTLAFHGAAYFYVRNEKLTARAASAEGSDPSAPFRELQPGVVLSGPLRKRWNLLGSLSWETARVYTRQPAQDFTVPTRSWIASLSPQSLASLWMRPFAASAPALPGNTWTYSLAPPLHINRQTFVPRGDWTSTGGSQHLSARYAGFFVDRPEFDYNPYAGFSVDLRDRTHSTAVTWTSSPRSRLANELRAGFSVDAFSALRPHPDVPILAVGIPGQLQAVSLPSSQAAGSFSNRTRSVELDENVSYYRGRHALRAGGGLISRGVSGILSSYDVPRFDFEDLTHFAGDQPDAVTISLARTNPLTAPLPDFNRRYSILDWYGFVQDSFRPWQRLTLSAGVRYDWFGSPANSGRTGDYLFSLPAAGDVAARLAAATLQPSGSAHLYDIRHNGLTFRGGLSYALDRRGRTVLRGAFGVYTDRPFDNLWQTIRNNDYSTLLAGLDGSTRNYTAIPSLLRALPAESVRPDFNDLTTFAPGFSTPRVMSWMSGIQHSLSERLLMEGNYLGSGSGSLVTTDRLNRPYSVPFTPGNPSRRYVAELPDIVYRANQGRSDYSALTLLLRYRSTRFISGLAYTLSRANDTQSDPLAGEFFDLGFGGGGLSPKASLIRQGDPSADWGHGDFDRRHNIVLSGSWMLPGFFEGFRLSFLGAVRSGSPFTVFGFPPGAVSSLLDNPADLVPGVPVWATRQSAGDGVQLLNPAAFIAVADHVGNSGRNRFYGPGLVEADASLSRRFHVRRLPERAVFAFRMDVYNVFNHANLGNPVSNLNDSAFGIATRGPQPVPNAFRIFAPLGDSRRQAQLSLKLEF